MNQGAEIPLEEIPKIQENPKKQIEGHFGTETDEEITKLLKVGVIEKSHDKKGQNISAIFLVPKPDGTHRLIVNLIFFL